MRGGGGGGGGGVRLNVVLRSRRSPADRCSRGRAARASSISTRLRCRRGLMFPQASACAGNGIPALPDADVSGIEVDSRLCIRIFDPLAQPGNLKEGMIRREAVLELERLLVEILPKTRIFPASKIEATGRASVMGAVCMPSLFPITITRAHVIPYDTKVGFTEFRGIIAFNVAVGTLKYCKALSGGLDKPPSVAQL